MRIRSEYSSWRVQQITEEFLFFFFFFIINFRDTELSYPSLISHPTYSQIKNHKDF